MNLGIEHQLTLLGSTVHYWEYNADKSPTILMVHGFRGNHHGLQHIIDQLPEYRIIAPDLPGFDASTPMEGPHDVGGYAMFVQEFAAALKLDHPVLLGHSFGSIIASYAAAAHPELYRKLILVNPIASPALEGSRVVLTQGAIFYYWLGRRLPEALGLQLLSNSAIVWAASAIMTKTKDKALRRKIHQSHLTHFSTFQNRSVLQEAFRASVSTTALDKAHDITTPTLLIAGEVDDIAPLAGQTDLEHRLPNAQLVVIPKVGHLIHHEAPQEAAMAIRQFLG